MQFWLGHYSTFGMLREEVVGNYTVQTMARELRKVKDELGTQIDGIGN